MKQGFKVSIVVAAYLGCVFCFGLKAEAADLQIRISGPEGLVSRGTVTFDYAADSSSSSDKLAVKLWQNDTLIRSEFASGERNNSGGFTITLSKDGTYDYYYTVTNGTDTARSPTRKITLDTVRPGPLVYDGAVRNGKTYTITFIAPNDRDVDSVKIFGSTSRKIQAGDATQVTVVRVSPGQPVTYTFSASESSPRYFALQAEDKAGNTSEFATDTGVEVASAAKPDNGTSGTVNAPGPSRTDINSNAADILSAGSDSDRYPVPKTGTSWVGWSVVLVLVAVALGYVNRESISALIRKARSKTK